MSIFFIASMAFIAREAFSRSGSASREGSSAGTICHERPKRSSSQPHATSRPPSEVSACHRQSI